MKKLLIMSSVVLLLSGCAHKTWLVQPEFNPANVKRVAVVVPNAKVNMIDVTNDITVDQELSILARAAIEKGTVEALKDRGFEVILLTNKEDVVTFLKGYGPLSVELAKHFPKGGTATRESKIDGFDKIRKVNNIDCVVAVDGLDHKSTPGRKARMLAAALLGVSGGHGLTYVKYSAFCGEDGKPMYSETLTKSQDLTDSSDVAGMVGTLVDHMKEVNPIN